MNYVSFVNELIRKEVSEAERIVLFGQNIAAGSCLSGLTKNLQLKKEGLIINSPNSENTLCGVGFGLMIHGVSSVFFIKQQDFLLLGIDHLVNTYNLIRQNKPSASFTIMNIIADSGYEGPQHSLNNFGDFCSIARIPGFTITNMKDAEQIITSHLVSIGFRIIGVSQRLFKKDIIDIDIIYSNNDGTLFQYTEGADATIVCFNFSFPQGLHLHEELKNKGLHTSLFSVNTVTPADWGPIIQNVRHTEKLIILDDSKSINRSCHHLATTVYGECIAKRIVIVSRELSDNSLRPNSDEFTVDSSLVMRNLS